MFDRYVEEGSTSFVDRTVSQRFTPARIIEAEGDLDIFEKWSGQRVAESDGEDEDGSSESSSENGQEDEEIEIDI